MPLLLAVACRAASVPLSGSVGPLPAVPLCEHPSGRSAAAPSPGPRSSEPILTVGWKPSTDSDYLVARDPVTLAPESPRRPLGEQGFHFYAFSPDGEQVAIVGGSPRIRVFDIASLRLVRIVRPASRLGAFIWTRDDVFIGVWQRGGGPHDSGTLAIDAVTGRRLKRTNVRDTLVDTQSTARGELVVLSTPNVDDARFGPARITVVGTDGGVRSQTLGQIESGFQVEKRKRRVGVQKTPGLAVDAAGERAFVVGKNEPVAEVDLETLAVRYHAPEPKTSLWARLTGALVSSAGAKGALGWDRMAMLLDDHVLAITGYDSKARGDGFPTPDPTGLQLVDTDTWESCMWSSTGGLVARGPEAFYVWRDGTAHYWANGLSAYDREGRRLWHAFGDEDVYTAMSGDYLYVRHGRDTIRESVVDPSTGEVLSNRRFYLTEIITPGPVRYPLY